MIKLDVINAERDDLHEFAEWFLNDCGFLKMNSLCRRVLNTGAAQEAIIHRQGKYQVELIDFEPNVDIPSHCHPGTESIEFPVAGAVHFIVDGFNPFDGMSEAMVRRYSKGLGLRIPQHAYHSGLVSREGAMILSFQRWDKPFAHIGQNWQGQYTCAEHELIGGEYAGL